MGNKIVFSIFLVIGIATLFWGNSMYQKSKEAEHWPISNGEVKVSEVESYIERDSRSHQSTKMYTAKSKSHHSTKMYKAKVVFEYFVNGVMYQSNKISFGEFSSSSPKHAQKVVDKYYVGTGVDVYYDPDNPAEGILEPGKIGGIVILFFMGGVFIIMSLFFLFGYIPEKR